MVRLQKYLADAGVASRRESEQLILDGKVKLNGVTVRLLGTKVTPIHDTVSVDNRPVKPRRKIYVALNKPPGFVCTRRDPEDRQVVSDLLPKEWGHLFTVGRLDRESDGLLLLTNDGDFSLRLTHPRYGIRKIYRVWVEGRVEPADCERFTKGIKDGGEFLKAERVKILSANNSHSSVEVELAQGKNREIRRLFDFIQRPVERLQRIQIGPVKLGQLPVARWRVLGEVEVKSLLKPSPQVPTLALNRRSSRSKKQP